MLALSISNPILTEQEDNPLPNTHSLEKVRSCDPGSRGTLVMLKKIIEIKEPLGQKNKVTVSQVHYQKFLNDHNVLSEIFQTLI